MCRKQTNCVYEQHELGFHPKLPQYFKRPSVVMLPRLVCHVLKGLLFHHWPGPQTVNTLVYLIEKDYGCVFAYACVCALCVCSCVSLLICSLSFVVFCCYHRDSSVLPVSHNALLFLSGCTRGRKVL